MNIQRAVALAALLLASYSTLAHELGISGLIGINAGDQLSDAELAEVARISTEDRVLWVQPISVNTKALASEEMTINLYDRQIQLRKGRTPRAPFDGVTMWSGYLVLDSRPDLRPPAYVLFVVSENGQIGGSITYGEFAYQIRALRSGRDVLLKAKVFPDAGCLVYSPDIGVPMDQIIQD